MAGAAIDDGHHVTRHCKPSQFDDDGKVTYAAFLLRRDEQGTPMEEYVSAFWLEAVGHPTIPQCLAGFRAACPAQTEINLSKTGVLAVLNVGVTRALVQERIADSRLLRITDENPPSFHAGIFDTTPDDDAVAAAILASVLSFEPTV